MQSGKARSDAVFQLRGEINFGYQYQYLCVPALLYLALALWRGEAHPAMPARVSNTRISQKAAIHSAA